MSHPTFGSRVIVTEPDEGNEEWQGRTGILITALSTDACGLGRFLVAFEGERSLLRFYAHEFLVQAPPPEVRTVEVTRIVKQKPSKAQIERAAMAMIDRITSRIKQETA